MRRDFERSYDGSHVSHGVQQLERPVPRPFTHVELGAKDPENPLPINDYKQLIIDTVHQNPVTIIVAETGAGKSTQVPQYLLQAGYIVNMTQPRRLAATMVSERIRTEVAEALGDPSQRRLVGLHTAEHNTVTNKTRVTVLTDGLRLAQELGDRGSIENEVLIIDEVHERNSNIEVLIAWTKRLIKENPSLRVVLMSATIDARRLAESYSDVVGIPPIIEVPGRAHDVDKIEEPHSTVFEQTVKYTEQDKNILVFLPGVREINDLQAKLGRYLKSIGREDVTVLPLYSGLSNQEQKAVDRFYPGPKIILATNIAQTSLTIKDIDVVVDSGLKRHIEIDDNEEVQSLELHTISQADSNQRAGRVGRTHPGIYVRTRLNAAMKFIPYNELDEYPIPEIQRSDITPYVLAVASKGVDFGELDLPLDLVRVERARHSLGLLGAVDETGKITPRGKLMNQFPVHPTLSRMLLESNNYSEEVKEYVAAVVASIEVGKLPSYLGNKTWRTLTKENQSDHLAQLDIFLATQGVRTNAELGRLGLDTRNIVRAQELYKKIIRRQGGELRPLQLPTEEQREEILECVLAGMVDFVYESSGGGTVTRALGGYAVKRVISDRSVVDATTRMMVGVPYQYGEGGKRRYILETVTSGDVPRMLGKVAAGLCTWKVRGSVRWQDEQPVQSMQQLFRGVIPTGNSRERPAEPSPELRTAILQYVLEHPGNAQKTLRSIKEELDTLGKLTDDRDIPQWKRSKLRRYVERATPDDVTHPQQVDANLWQIMTEEGITAIDDVVPQRRRAEIYAASDYPKAS